MRGESGLAGLAAYAVAAVIAILALIVGAALYYSRQDKDQQQYDPRRSHVARVTGTADGHRTEGGVLRVFIHNINIVKTICYAL
jgi:uncharacterized iron-regulated membrane protein